MLASLLINTMTFVYWYSFFFSCFLTHCQPGAISHVGQLVYFLTSIILLIKYDNNQYLLHTYPFANGWGFNFTKVRQSWTPCDARTQICFAIGSECFTHPFTCINWKGTIAKYLPVLRLRTKGSVRVCIPYNIEHKLTFSIKWQHHMLPVCRVLA